MNNNNVNMEKIFWEIFNTKNEDELHKYILDNPIFSDQNNWYPYGGKDKSDKGNFGAFEAQQPNAVAALVEKLTNSIDALLLKQCKAKGINPKGDEAPESMSDAVELFYDVKNGDFSEVGPKRRREIAEDIQIIATDEKEHPNLTIYDNGEGQHPEDFPRTFLSLLTRNKTGIRFVQGKYNMGSTGAVVFCGNRKYQLIASRRNPKLALKNQEDLFGFTLVRRHPLTEQEEKEHITSWYEYFTINGKVPSFHIDEIDIGLAMGKQFKYGSIIKLYSYQLPKWSRSDIRLNLWRDLNQYLYHPALPMLILDKRFGDDRAHQGKPILGNKTRITIDDRNKKEFTRSYSIKNKRIGEAKIEATVFKPEVKQKEFINSKALIFTRNGQVHGFKGRSFISQDLGLAMLRDSMLIQVDCSNLRRTFEQDLFMANRYNLKEGETLDELIEYVINVLKADKNLKEVNQNRKSRILREDKEDKELLETLLQTIPLDKELLKLLKKDGTLDFLKRTRNSYKTDNGTEIVDTPIASKRFPSIFKLNLREDKNGKKIKSIPLNGKGYIEFETDVESEYLLRPKDQGELELQILNTSNNETKGGTRHSKPTKVEDIFTVTVAGPSNNSIKIMLEPQEGIMVGDEIELNARLSSPDGDLESIFHVKIVDPRKTKQTTRKKEPTYPALPKPIRVYEKAEKDADKTWSDIGNWTGEDIVKVYPGDDGNVIDAIAINMDSYSLKRYLSRRKVNTTKAVSFARNRFFSSVYLHSLFLYSIFDKLKRQDEYEALDIEELLPTLMKPYSSFLIYANTDEEMLNSFAED